MNLLRLAAFASASLVFAVAAAGCAGNVSDDESMNDGSDPASSTDVASQALHGTPLGKKLVGEWQVPNSLYPRVSIHADQTYSWDTGIRCVKAPCPSGDEGVWNLYAAGSARYLGLFANDGSERWFRVYSHANGSIDLYGRWGTTEHLVKKQQVTTTCMTARCSAGYHCEDNGGTVNAHCVPDPTPVDAGSGPQCPPDGTINCMPTIGSSTDPACSGTYHTWVEQNCPGVGFVY